MNTFCCFGIKCDCRAQVDEGEGEIVPACICTRACEGPDAHDLEAGSDAGSEVPELADSSGEGANDGDGPGEDDPPTQPAKNVAKKVGPLRFLRPLRYMIA